MPTVINFLKKYCPVQFNDLKWFQSSCPYIEKRKLNVLWLRFKCLSLFLYVDFTLKRSFKTGVKIPVKWIWLKYLWTFKRGTLFLKKKCGLVIFFTMDFTDQWSYAILFLQRHHHRCCSDHADQQYFHINIKAKTVYKIEMYQNDNIQRLVK